MEALENNDIQPVTSWRDSLPDDLRDSSTLKDVKDVDSLAKQFVDQSKFLGNSIRLPGDDATPEARQEFRQRLLDKNVGLMETPNPEDSDAMNVFYDQMGRPKESKDYTRPENGVDDSRFALLSDAAHKAGISNKQFEQVMGTIVGADAQVMETINTERQAGLTALRDEWSTAYDSKVEKTAKLAELTGAPNGLVDAIKGGKVDAATLKWLDSLGSSIGGETSELINQGVGEQTGTTKDEALARSMEILDTLSKMSQSDPRYNELMQKRVKYMEIVTG